MSIRDNVGTPLSLIIGGVPFRAHGDCDIAQVLAEWQTEFLPTSGSPMRQMKKVVPQAKSVDIAANADDLVLLAAFAESRINIPLGWVSASGVTWMGAGSITLEDYSHFNGKQPATFSFSDKPKKVG